MARVFCLALCLFGAGAQLLSIPGGDGQQASAAYTRLEEARMTAKETASAAAESARTLARAKTEVSKATAKEKMKGELLDQLRKQLIEKEREQASADARAAALSNNAANNGEDAGSIAANAREAAVAVGRAAQALRAAQEYVDKQAIKMRKTKRDWMTAKAFLEGLQAQREAAKERLARAMQEKCKAHNDKREAVVCLSNSLATLKKAKQALESHKKKAAAAKKLFKAAKAAAKRNAVLTGHLNQALAQRDNADRKLKEAMDLREDARKKATQHRAAADEVDMKMRQHRQEIESIEIARDLAESKTQATSSVAEAAAGTAYELAISKPAVAKNVYKAFAGKNKGVYSVKA